MQVITSIQIKRKKKPAYRPPPNLDDRAINVFLFGLILLDRYLQAKEYTLDYLDHAMVLIAIQTVTAINTVTAPTSALAHGCMHMKWNSLQHVCASMNHGSIHVSLVLP